MDWMPLILAVLSSNVVTAGITSWVARKKTGAEATETLVRAALSLENVASSRYEETAEALSEAQACIRVAQEQLNEYAEYIKSLQSLLEHSGISYPQLGGSIAHQLSKRGAAHKAGGA